MQLIKYQLVPLAHKLDSSTFYIEISFSEHCSLPLFTEIWEERTWADMIWI